MEIDPRDWKNHIQIGDGPYWVEYDHVVEVLVEDGEMVKQGQPLARAAPASIRHGGPEAVSKCLVQYLIEEDQQKLEWILETMRSQSFTVGESACLVSEL